MNAVHPVMQQALANIAPPSPLTDYHKALASFDWQYDMCDDHRRWAAGVNALARLRKMQQQLDRDGSIWLSYPGAHTHGAPAPLIASMEAA